jgi:phenylacetate-CoA ligase
MSGLLDTLSERLIGQWLLPLYETRLRGRATFRYRAEFEANQWRSAGEIAALQWSRLRALLQHAYDSVAYYRALFDDLGLRPDAIAGPDDFARLPIRRRAPCGSSGTG